MKSHSVAWFGLTIAAALVVVVGAWQGRGAIQQWASDDAARQFSRKLQTLHERQAARQIAHAPAADGQWLEALVTAWADPRGEVALAARVAVLSEVERWSQQSAAEFEPPLGDLARYLAQHAPQMNDVEREAARALAERLLLWPASGNRIGAARLIADCEAVLGLPPAPLSEIRVAASPAPLPAPQIALPQLSPSLPEVAWPPQSPALIQPQPAAPLAPPLPLPDANQESPAAPRPFSAPKAIRISDD